MATHRLSDKEILAQIPAATARAKLAQRTEPHAYAAQYDRSDRALHIELTNGASFSLPVDIIPELKSASETELEAIQIGPAGVGLHWEALDADLSVAGLAKLVLGSSALMSAAGTVGGSAKSPAKAAAARNNGLKGGRPAGRQSHSSAQTKSRKSTHLTVGAPPLGFKSAKRTVVRSDPKTAQGPRLQKKTVLKKTLARKKK